MNPLKQIIRENFPLKSFVPEKFSSTAVENFKKKKIKIASILL